MLDLKEWNDKEIFERSKNITNNEKIRIHELLMTTKILSKNLLNEVMENYNLSLNIENTLVDAFSKQNLKNLSDENAKNIQIIYKEIVKSQDRQIKNYPIFEQIKEFLRENDINQ